MYILTKHSKIVSVINQHIVITYENKQNNAVIKTLYYNICTSCIVHILYILVCISLIIINIKLIREQYFIYL